MKLPAASLCSLALIAAGCGGDDDDNAKSAKDVESCLKEEKLQVTTVPGGAAGRQDTITILLPEDSNVINVAFYDDEDNAKKGEDDAKIGVEAVDSGGSVKRDGTVVITNLRGGGGSDDALGKVEGCL